MGAPAATTGDAAAECLAVDEPLEARTRIRLTEYGRKLSLALGWLDRRDSPAWRGGVILTLIK
jgi:hypothetical protein